MSKQAYKRIRKALHVEINRKPLPKYTSVGCYPIFYLCADGECLCADCVNSEIEQIDFAIKTNSRDGWRVVDCDVNYENASMYCAHCDERIESAYAEDEAPDDSDNGVDVEPMDNRRE